MVRRARKPIFWKMLQEIQKIKQEFGQEDSLPKGVFTPSLEINLNRLRNLFNQSRDLIIRHFRIGDHPAALVYVDGLIDKHEIEWSILRPLMQAREPYVAGQDDLLSGISAKLMTVVELKRTSDWETIPGQLLNGNTIILVNGVEESLIVNTPGWDKRALEQPDSEVTLKGPRVGFIESLRTNTALLRYYISDPNLTFETMTIGEKTRTPVSICYLKGVANEGLITEVKRRIGRIKTDAILAAGFVEQFIEDNPFSLFSTTGYSERPDVVAAQVLEGRAAIITEGTPVVITVPYLFLENFQSPDDYNFRFIYGSLLRWFRYISFTISLLAPAAYVALATFHQELIPTPLLITMAEATEGTPFPSVIEILVMGLFFEILREGGIRLPKPVGQAISIVGALVIGQATVQAGLVGAPTLIVISLTAVSSFVVPTLVDETTPLRFILVILAGLLGAFGIMIGLLLLLIHLASLRSFGVPYLSPITPTNLRGLAQDVVIRAPLWAMWKRPAMLAPNDPERQQFRLMPKPPRSGGEENSRR
jgi:spore germination protein KA